MNRQNVCAAVYEAQQFIARCNALLVTDVDEWDENTLGRIMVEWQSYGSPKEQGAVRRASMDLTRALAEMRKP